MKSVIGLDYGTQSARAILVNAQTGDVLCSHTVAYPHGVMDGDLASAADYEDALAQLLEAVTPPQYRESICGICVDATSLTLVPLNAQGQVLAQVPELRDHPHAQIKLWKCHTAQTQADEALALAEKTNQPFLRRTGGTISCEWMLPKLLKIRDDALEVYAHMDLALDLCEFLTYRLTGQLVRSAGAMAFKCLWSRDLGLPDKDYLDDLRKGFGTEYHHLLRGDVRAPGSGAGKLSTAWCQRLGLKEDVTVAVGVLDGHTAHVALGALGAGDAALVVGTSNVLTVQCERLHEIEGICGIALDGLTEGLYGIDSGQACTGDMLQWYMENALPIEIWEKSNAAGMDPHALLSQCITEPWNNRLVALDWWNGSRNVPCDLTLPGALVGLNLATKPQDIYLALLQGIVCGTREIIEQCASYGVSVHRLLATGGITGKNPLLMQQYADILGMQVLVGQFAEGPALGAAIFASVASGIYSEIKDAYHHMGVRCFTTYTPHLTYRAEYETIYQKNHHLRKMLQEESL